MRRHCGNKCTLYSKIQLTKSSLASLVTIAGFERRISNCKILKKQAYSFCHQAELDELPPAYAFSKIWSKIQNPMNYGWSLQSSPGYQKTLKFEFYGLIELSLQRFFFVLVVEGSSPGSAVAPFLPFAVRGWNSDTTSANLVQRLREIFKCNAGFSYASDGCLFSRSVEIQAFNRELHGCR